MTLGHAILTWCVPAPTARNMSCSLMLCRGCSSWWAVRPASHMHHAPGPKACGHCCNRVAASAQELNLLFEHQHNTTLSQVSTCAESRCTLAVVRAARITSRQCVSLQQQCVSCAMHTCAHDDVSTELRDKPSSQATLASAQSPLQVSPLSPLMSKIMIRTHRPGTVT